MKKKDVLEEQMEGAFAQTKEGFELLKDPKIKEATKAAVISGQADEAIGRKTSKKTKEKVIKHLDNPKKLNKLAKGKNTKGIDSLFTGAIGHFLPLIIGGAIGGVDGAIAGHQGFQASLERDRKRQLEERELSLKERAGEGTEAIKAAQLEEMQRLQQERATGEQGLTRREERQFQLQESSLNQRAALAQAAAQRKIEDKPLNEQQSKSRLFGKRMYSAESILTGLENSPDFDPASIPGNIADATLPNALKSEERQKYNQAKQDFLTAVLRKESGAVIGEREIALGDSQYFPVAGDSKAVVEQKRRNRELATQELLEQGKVDLDSLPPTSLAATSTMTLDQKKARYQELLAKRGR